MEINWSYIFHAPETNPAKDRLVIDRAGCRSTLVGVPDMAAALKVAQELSAVISVRTARWRSSRPYKAKWPWAV